MPANLTPEYEKADAAFRQAASDEERLDALREMLRSIPKHKGTEKMQADLKRRISQLRKTQGKKGARRGPDPFHIPKGGAGQVVLAGPPNVGKSLLVGTTTNASVKVADYPFTTGIPVPGMWSYEDVQIELVDTPPLTVDHVIAGLMGTIRAADIICLVVDGAAEPLEQAEMVLNVLASRGLMLRSVPRSELETGGDLAQHSGLIVANKSDVAPPENISSLRELYAGKLEVLAVSAATGEGLAELLKRLWDLLKVIRVYTKEPSRPPDLDKPFTLNVGSTVGDLAIEIHRELGDKLKFARIWGDGRFPGQRVRRDEVLRDKDIVELRQ